MERVLSAQDAAAQCSADGVRVALHSSGNKPGLCRAGLVGSLLAA